MYQEKNHISRNYSYQQSPSCRVSRPDYSPQDNYFNLNNSIDPFSSPKYQPTQTSNEAHCSYFQSEYYRKLQNVECQYAEPQPRTSSQSLARAIKNGIDLPNDEFVPDGGWRIFCSAVQTEMLSHTQSTSSSSKMSYNMDTSVIIEKEKEEKRISKKKSSGYFEKWKLKKEKKPTNNCFEEKEKINTTKPKQIPMDAYLFKAKRIEKDKGTRHFGLKTLQEPTRGSRKKRKSVENLELTLNKKDDEKNVVNTYDSGSENQINEHDILDETLPITPSPIKNISRKRSSTIVEDQEIRNSAVKKSRLETCSRSLFNNTSCQRNMNTKEILSNFEPTFNEDPKKEKILQPLSCQKIEKLNSLKKIEIKTKELTKKSIEREKLMRDLVENIYVKDGENAVDNFEKQQKIDFHDGQVIRNKQQRQHLMHGTSCKCCRKYYDNLELSPKAKEQFINQVSRHRYVHNALPDTPERYWDLTMGPEDEALLMGTRNQNHEWATIGKGKTEKLKSWN